jgi:beta-xylosidase
MMQWIKMCAVALGLVVIISGDPVLAGQSTRYSWQDHDQVMLFAYFLDSGKTGVYLAYSVDGLHFKPLNGGKPIFRPPHWAKHRKRIIRDPSIIYHGGKFRMVWTAPLKPKGFGYASSPDLEHWSEPKKVRPFPPTLAREDRPENIWAPDIQWDPVRNDYIIIWSTTTPREYNDNDGSRSYIYHHDNRLYATRTRHFKHFTPAKLFFDQGFNVIDGHLVYDNRGTPRKDDDRWILVCKNDWAVKRGGKNLRLSFTGRFMDRPFTQVSKPIVGPGSSIRAQQMVEGPSLIRFHHKWLLYGDAYTSVLYTDSFVGHHFSGGQYVLASSPDLVHWTDRTTQLAMPTKHPRHGTILVVPRSTVAFLRKGSKPGH